MLHCFPGLPPALPKGNRAPVGLAKESPRQPYPGHRIAGIQFDRLLEVACGPVQVSVIVPIEEKTAFHVSVEGFGIDGTHANQIGLLLRGQTDLDLPRHGSSYIIFQTENISGAIVVILSPKMALVLHLKKLDSDAQMIPAPAKAVFQHILNSKVTSNLVQALVTVFVSHHGGSRDDSQLFWVKPAQLCNRLFCQTVRKVLLFGITGEILEGQHGQHDFFRSWRRRSPKTPPGSIAPDYQSNCKRAQNRSCPPATPCFRNCRINLWRLENVGSFSWRVLVVGFRFDGYSRRVDAGRRNLRRIPFRDVWSFGQCEIACELVPLSANRNDQPAVFRAFTQRLAQVRNVLREIRLFNEGVPPDRLEQFVLCNQPVGVFGEEKQDVEGFRREGDGRFVAVKCSSLGIQHIRSEAL